jgi:hypothetical protein
MLATYYYLGLIALIAFIINDFRLLFKNNKPLTRRVRRIIWVSSGSMAMLGIIAIGEVCLFPVPELLTLMFAHPTVIYWSWFVEGALIAITCVCRYLENKE